VGHQATPATVANTVINKFYTNGVKTHFKIAGRDRGDRSSYQSRESRGAGGQDGSNQALYGSVVQADRTVVIRHFMVLWCRRTGW
jgi:hypothetical protein